MQKEDRTATAPVIQTEPPTQESKRIAKLDSVSIEEEIAQIDEEIDRYTNKCGMARRNSGSWVLYMG
jgi:hypothetical protein